MEDLNWNTRIIASAKYNPSLEELDQGNRGLVCLKMGGRRSGWDSEPGLHRGTFGKHKGMEEFDKWPVISFIKELPGRVPYQTWRRGREETELIIMVPTFLRFRDSGSPIELNEILEDPRKDSWRVPSFHAVREKIIKKGRKDKHASRACQKSQ